MENVNFEHNDESDESVSMMIWYIIFVIISQVFFIILGYKWVRAILKEFGELFIDSYKLAQLTLLLGFIFFRNLFEYLWFINAFWFYYIPVSLFIMIWFYFFVNMNSWCWISFFLHIESCEFTEWYTEENMKKVKIKEWWIKISMGALMTLILALAVIINILSAIYNWHKFDSFNGKIIENNAWSTLSSIAMATSYILLSIGAISAIIKIIVGYIILKKMRQKFKYIYNKLKKSIIFTTALTSFIIIINGIFNIVEENKFTDFSLYIVRGYKHFTPYSYIKILLSLINLSSEIILMYINIRLLDFKDFVIKLMEGRKREDLLPHVSIFLWFNKNSKEYSNHTKRLLQERQISGLLNEDEGEDNKEESLLTSDERKKDIWGFL